MVKTAPSTLARPPAQGRSASRIASDRQGATWASPETAVSEQLTRRHDRTAASCIGRARPHRGNSHPGRRRFSGHTRDGRYCRARYYHPQLQRFISEDPIGFAGGDANLYGYVGNSPTNLIDPTGQFIFLPPVVVVGGAVALGVALTAVLTAGGDTSPSPPALSGRKDNQPSQYVVRGGLAKPEDLIKGTGPHRDIPGLTGFSVQHRPGLSVDELTRGGQIPNLQITVTTVPVLRQHGFNVVYPTPGRGQYHATVQTPYPLTFEQAVLLNSLFIQQPNPYPYRPR